MPNAKISFNAGKFGDELKKSVIKEQTKRLIAYAREELYEMIVSKTFKSRTFNLADSYVWAVYKDKKEQGHGWIGAKMATERSYLHEWSKNPIPVDGRKEAQDFLKRFKDNEALEHGWTVVWAACAPYGMYLDPAAGHSKTNRFMVISQRYDQIKGELEPKCHVEFKVM